MTKTGIVLRVPGPWSDHGALAKINSSASSGLAQIEMEPHDPDLQRVMVVGADRSLDSAANAALHSFLHADAWSLRNWRHDGDRAREAHADL